ncbi:MAG: hypothetical protein ACKVY0_26150 [Prosthecobacter sp.]|uniref:hypothetical protein n=1 Tax=Prosthecobacter sp. TaxID=1965333 RepID=UPI0038FE2371
MSSTARLGLFLLICLPCQLSFAADWNAISKAPPVITALQMQAKPLVVSADKTGWARIPEMLTQRGAVIYMPDGEHLGVADIQVISDGYLFIACNWDYQGNQSGDWDKDAWDERKFKTKGWDKLTKGELGGELIRNNNRVQTVFVKRVKKGDTFRLRCNKYDPPYPILLNSKP